MIKTTRLTKNIYNTYISYNWILKKWQLYSIDKIGWKTFIMLCDSLSCRKIKSLVERNIVLLK